MCGIAGVFSSRDRRSDVVVMRDFLSHRGPDDNGVGALTGIDRRTAGWFGHTRLSIVDLSPAGHQPMYTPDERFCITFNGEIYNYPVLREDLQRGGTEFRGHSDTEVLLRGWEAQGPAFLKKLRGMFAFAIWDRVTQEGWLVRDAFGIKPLYVTLSDGDVLFASEVKAILATGRIARTLSSPGIASFLATGSIAEPWTIVEGITAVPPGHVLPITKAGADWCIGSSQKMLSAFPSASSDIRDRATNVRNIRAALRQSVSRHLVADVPVGVFLSGGIDSAAIAGLAAEVSAKPIDSFTVTFDEKQFSEGEAAGEAARRFGTRHHAVPVAASHVLHALPDFFAAMDQPSLDGLNTFVVSRAVRTHGLKVVLSGLGGDELFGGYPSFRRARRIAPVWRLPRSFRKVAATAVGVLPGTRADRIASLLRESSASGAAYTVSRTLFTESQVKNLMLVEVSRTDAAERGATDDGLSLTRQVSMHETAGYMLNTLLRDSDVFSMAHGLELRVPFIDVDVAAAATAAAASDDLERAGPKPFLVDAVRDLLPPQILSSPKKGFTLPFETWLRQELFEEVESVIGGPGLPAIGLASETVSGVWKDFHQRKAGLNWSRPWALYTLARWTAENGFTAKS